MTGKRLHPIGWQRGARRADAANPDALGGELRSSRKCTVCGGPTREHKPFCFDHLEALPYVAALIEEVEARDLERASGVFPPSGPPAEASAA